MAMTRGDSTRDGASPMSDGAPAAWVSRSARVRNEREAGDRMVGCRRPAMVSFTMSPEPMILSATRTTRPSISTLVALKRAVSRSIHAFFSLLHAISTRISFAFAAAGGAAVVGAVAASSPQLARIRKLAISGTTAIAR